MPAPVSADEFLVILGKSQLVDSEKVEAALRARKGPALTEAKQLAQALQESGIITKFQAEQLLKGKFRGFTVGKYKVLDRLGAGGMGQVFLCEHPQLRRRAAVKVLPTDRAHDPALLGRFLREARAAASLDHPNIVRAFDVDEDKGLHYLVMEYIEGSDLYHIVKDEGQLPVERACEYIRQGALGLQYAHEAGLIHRDVKPSNFLVEKSTSMVKLLDLGLARFTEEGTDALTQRFDGGNVLGTADYVAPEQTRDSHEVDQRCDIYALGGTFYFLLTGKSPFPDGTPADKMIAHRSRKPTPVRQFRPDVPPALVNVIDKMMAKNPSERHQTANQVIEALAPWVANAAPTPSGVELPREPLLPVPTASIVLPAPNAPPPRALFRLGWPAIAALIMLGCGLGVAAGQFLRGPTTVVRSTGGR